MAIPADGAKRRRWPTAQRMSWLLALSVSLVALFAIPFDGVPWLRGPAPYPPEWQWPFRPGGAVHSLLPAVALAAAILLLVAATGSAWARRHQRAMRRTAVVAAVLLGWAFQLALLERDADRPLGALARHTESPVRGSFLRVAASPVAIDPLAFLRDYAALLPSFEAKDQHAATHPPGPVLYYRGLLAVMEASPRLDREVTGALGVKRDHHQPRPALQAAALIGALVLGLLAAFVAVPVAGLGSILGRSPLAGARTALLWALLPGSALMQAWFDPALALPIAVTAWMLLRAGLSPSPRRRVVYAVAAGCSGAVALFFSYGALAFLGATALAVIVATLGDADAAAAPKTSWANLRLAIAAPVVAAAVAIATAFLVPAALGGHPFSALVTALAIHLRLYTEPRSYLSWVIFDPLDLAIFLGLPLAVVGIARAVETLRRRLTGRPVTRAELFGLAAWSSVAGLVLLGDTRGEVGRIWIPLMPMLLVGSLALDDPGERRYEVLLIAALLAAFTVSIGAYWIV